KNIPITKPKIPNRGLSGKINYSLIRIYSACLLKIIAKTMPIREFRVQGGELKVGSSGWRAGTVGVPPVTLSLSKGEWIAGNKQPQSVKSTSLALRQAQGDRWYPYPELSTRNSELLKLPPHRKMNFRRVNGAVFKAVGI